MAALNAAQRRTSSSSGSSQNGSPASRPVFTTSAMPSRRCALGQRLEQRRVDHRAVRPVEGADEVLALRQVDRRLAADRRVDLGDEARRHRRPGDAAEVRRRGETGRVGRAAAAERDDRPAAVEAQLLPEPVEGRERLRLLARRQLVRLGEPRAERELRVHAVDAGDVRVRDERDRAVAGDELAEPLQRAALDVDAGGGEHDVVAVARGRVGHLGVERRAAARSGARNSASSCASGRSLPRDPLPRRLDVDGEMDDGRAVVAREAGVSTAPPPTAITVGSAARAPRARTAPRARGTRPRPRSRRARDRAVRRRDRLVDVDERPAEPRATSQPSVVLPAPMKPTRTTCRSSAPSSRSAPGTRARRRRSRRARRRRTSRAPRARAPTRPPPRRRPRAPRPPRRRSARRARRPARRSRGRRSASGRISVGSGFIAARTTISSPFETPPSMPPARFVSRCRPRSSRTISSCASEPRSPESAKPSPISTPFTAWIPISAAASRASSRSSRRAYEPSPGGTPRARTSTRPPSVSRSLRASSTAAGSAPASGSASPATSIPISREQRLRDRAGRDVDRRMPRRGALERVADVGEAVLLHAGEIGVPGPRQRDRLRPLPLGLALGRPRAHPPRPVLVVAVADDERERRAERAAVAEAREHLDLVGLDLLARRAAVALLAAAEVGVDRLPVEDEARRAGPRRSRRAPARATLPRSRARASWRESVVA